MNAFGHYLSLPLALCLITGWGCSARTPAYADAYGEALERYPGTDQVTPDMTDGFVAFFSQQANAPQASQLYGERLYFSDTLLTSEERTAVLDHLARMHAAATEMTVTVLDKQIDGQDVYLVWQMHATFTPVASPVRSNSLGVTHLRFGPDGRIVLQQDFWDSAEGLYRHVPVVGGLIRIVRGRFEHAPAD